MVGRLARGLCTAWPSPVLLAPRAAVMAVSQLPCRLVGVRRLAPPPPFAAWSARAGAARMAGGRVCCCYGATRLLQCSAACDPCSWFRRPLTVDRVRLCARARRLPFRRFRSLAARRRRPPCPSARRARVSSRSTARPWSSSSPRSSAPRLVGGALKWRVWGRVGGWPLGSHKRLTTMGTRVGRGAHPPPRQGALRQRGHPRPRDRWWPHLADLRCGILACWPARGFRCSAACGSLWGVVSVAGG